MSEVPLHPLDCFRRVAHNRSALTGRGSTRRHPGVELRGNIKSISHRCHLFEVAFVWELTKETIRLPLGCLQGGWRNSMSSAFDQPSEGEQIVIFICLGSHYMLPDSGERQYKCKDLKKTIWWTVSNRCWTGPGSTPR